MPYRDERLDTVFLLSRRDKKMSFRTRSFTTYVNFVFLVSFGLLFDICLLCQLTALGHKQISMGIL